MLLEFVVFLGCGATLLIEGVVELYVVVATFAWERTVMYSGKT